MTFPSSVRNYLRVPANAGFLRKYAGRIALTGAVAIAAAGLAGPITAAGEVEATRQVATGIVNGIDPAAAAAEQQQAPAAAPAAPTTPAAPGQPAPTIKKPEPVAPAKVAGLSDAQMKNAETIVRVGQSMGLDERAQTIALMTAMQESNLRNLASDVIPESMNYDHQGTGSDHDSVGLFQQRPSMGWGSTQEIMTPEHSAKAFYERLAKIDYSKMGLGEAAQTVQVSAFPDHYDKHAGDATSVVNSVKDADGATAKQLAEAQKQAEAAGVQLS